MFNPSCPRIIKQFIFCFLLFVSFTVSAQKKKAAAPPPPQLTRIEFVFDASLSMTGKWQTGFKIDVAKRLMTKLLDSLRYVPHLELALRVYARSSRRKRRTGIPSFSRLC